MFERMTISPMVSPSRGTSAKDSSTTRTDSTLIVLTP